MLTGTYPRGAVSAEWRIETYIRELDDSYSYVDRQYNTFWLPFPASGGEVQDGANAWAYTNCADHVNFPYTEMESYYVLRIVYPQKTLLVGTRSHTLDWVGFGTWECWNS